MEVFKIYDKDETVETFQNNAGVFKLLVHEGDFEVYESTINKGKSILFQPYETADAINFIFVLSGKLLHTNTLNLVNAGEKIVLKNLSHTQHFSVIEPSQLLTVRNCKHFLHQASKTNKVYDMIHQIQSKDQYTETHCNNAGNLAVQLATLMHLPEQTIDNILHGAKIHDVGKLFVPEEILNKPAKLSYEEYEIIKKHVVDGYNLIFKETQNIELSKLALEHHERLDGSGYPYGLKGDEISISSRIMAVVDSFDAMTSDRPYKKGITHEAAIEELKKYAGTWYDSEVIHQLEALLNSLKKHL